MELVEAALKNTEEIILLDAYTHDDLDSKTLQDQLNRVYYENQDKLTDVKLLEEVRLPSAAARKLESTIVDENTMTLFELLPTS